MVEGDKWELFIPSNLAYGEAGRLPAIGRGDALVFTIEMLAIKGRRVSAATPAISHPPPPAAPKHPPPPAEDRFARTLPRCTDPFQGSPIDCSTLEHVDEVMQTLCPRIVAVQRASCSQLASVSALADLLDNPNMTVLRAVRR